MRYSDLKLVITSQFKEPGGNAVAYYIEGKPGGGKSALCRDIVRSLGGTEENTVEFNASMRDPVDILGTPRNNGEYTQWMPPEEFWKLRRGVGPCFLIAEELSDASVPMQNSMCRVFHDRHAGNLALSDQLFIVASGNRTEDKSGANRMTTKLANRMRFKTFDENLDDWVDWAQAQDIDPVLIQYIRFKPDALSDFDPARKVNATPRAWERASKISTALSSALYFDEVTGDVGQGRAAEYVAFRKVYADLVSLEDVVMSPKTVKVPTDLSALYATVGSCGYGTTVGNVERISEFMDRLPDEFRTMYWMDARKKEPKIKATKAFVKWATDNANVVLN